MPDAPRMHRALGSLTGVARRQANDLARKTAKPWRRLYGTARWQRLRAEQLAREPLCRMCAEAGRVTAATVCDHVDPHRGDEAKFWAGPFQSLCDAAPWRCHSRAKQREERRPGGGLKSPRPCRS